MLTPPFELPRGDPSTMSQILSAFAPTGEPIVSVVFGMSFHVVAGKCVPNERFKIQHELVYTPADVVSEFTRPSLLARDIDTYAWRNFTDLVVRGTARSQELVDSLEIELAVAGGPQPFKRRIVATGDRFVDKGRAGLVLTPPIPFLEMPMRYDRAYGGTDEIAEATLEDPDHLRMINLAAAEDAAEISEYSYPRNPAGKGYLIVDQGLVDLPWPNLEFPEERLALDEKALVRPLAAWGGRPYPAAFDWFPHAWFPRCGYFSGFPETEDGRYPRREIEMGMFKDGEEELAWLERPKHGLANGGHPYLSRTRFRGDEVIHVTHMSPDGRPFEARLPAMRPRVAFHFLGPRIFVDASIDLVLVETETNEVTVLWRATLLHPVEHLPIYWVEQSPYEISW